MENLPDNADKLSASFTKLDASRKDEILAHLHQTKGERLQATVSNIISNGGVEAEFVKHIFGKDIPDPGAARDTKKINPVQKK